MNFKTFVQIDSVLFRPFLFQQIKNITNKFCEVKIVFFLVKDVCPIKLYLAQDKKDNKQVCSAANKLFSERFAKNKLHSSN